MAESAPLQRTRAEVDRYLSRGIPGITPEVVEAMEQDGRVVIVEEQVRKP